MRHIQGQTDGDRLTARQTSRDGGSRDEGQTDGQHSEEYMKKTEMGIFRDKDKSTDPRRDRNRRERESRESRRGAQTESGRRSRRGAQTHTPGRPGDPDADGIRGGAAKPPCLPRGPPRNRACGAKQRGSQSPRDPSQVPGGLTGPGGSPGGQAEAGRTPASGGRRSGRAHVCRRGRWSRDSTRGAPLSLNPAPRSSWQRLPQPALLHFSRCLSRSSRGRRPCLRLRGAPAPGSAPHLPLPLAELSGRAPGCNYCPAPCSRRSLAPLLAASEPLPGCRLSESPAPRPSTCFPERQEPGSCCVSGAGTHGPYG